MDGFGAPIGDGGAGTIAQSIAADAYRGVISLVGHLAHDTTGMSLLDFASSGATVRAIDGGGHFGKFVIRH